VADHPDPADPAGPRRALAVPCFAENPADLVALGIDAERAGLDGFFLWDHLVHSTSGQGPPIVDPWQVLAVVAVGTTRIKLAVEAGQGGHHAGPAQQRAGHPRRGPRRPGR
jgi:alkanesulfonate monooxygenase SsuD/methylene tetrahydromethanopterin reductase-like flavin-dependent oxidoreductase (luciferase family)